MKKIVLMLILLICSTFAVQEQEENADWQVALLDVESHEVVFVTSNGLSDQPLLVPEGLYDPTIGLSLAFELSPDSHYLAYPVIVSEAGTAEILTADLVE